MVRVAVLGLPVAFAAQAITMVPPPVPEDGETVHQVWLLLIVQDQPVVRTRFTLPALQSTLKVF